VDRLARLQAVTSALSSARTPDEVAAVAVGAGVEALGGTAGFVLVGHASELQVLRAGERAEDAARCAASAIPGPAVDAFLTAEPVFLAGPADLAARYPNLSAEASRLGGACELLPLVAAGRALGVLAVSFEGARAFGDAERAFALALAAQCAHALDRARLLVAERVARAEADAARRRLAFTDGLSAYLAETEDRGEMLDGVLGLVVSALGDWAGVYLADEGGGLELTAQRGPAALGAAVDDHLRGGARGRLERACCCGGVVVLHDLPPAGGEVPPAVLLVPLCLRSRSLGVLAIAAADARPAPAEADLALLADVGHRTALALEHARLLEEATGAARAREEFLHVASHELRAPVATLKLAVHLLRRNSRGAEPDAYEARLRVLDRQVARLCGLSETLLDVSRITAGKLELAREDGDLAALVRDVAGRFQDEAAEGGSTLEVDAPPALRCALDPTRIDQVISNLVSNAVKYGRGAPIRVRVRPEGGRAVVEVADGGIGIAPEHQERIFERFERAVSARNYAGLGLGLWIVRRVVEAHGGTIRVRSAPGEGSTFTVELPL
jgi:signal transduction histidine kinase